MPEGLEFEKEAFAQTKNVEARPTVQDSPRVQNYQVTTHGPGVPANYLEWDNPPAFIPHLLQNEAAAKEKQAQFERDERRLQSEFERNAKQKQAALDHEIALEKFNAEQAQLQFKQRQEQLRLEEELKKFQLQREELAADGQHRRFIEKFNTLARPVAAVGLWTAGVIIGLYGAIPLAGTLIGAGTSVFLMKDVGKKKGKQTDGDNSAPTSSEDTSSKPDGNTPDGTKP